MIIISSYTIFVSDVLPAKHVELEVPKKDVINKPEEASAEFGVLLNEILKVLMENETDNLELLKSICSSLTIKDNSNILLFSDDKLKAIITCASIKLLFLLELRKCWRWDDFSVLRVLVESLHSNRCEVLLAQYKEKLDVKIKLKDIYDQCIKHNDFPEGYHKMVAITNKLFSNITKEEYDELKCFISQHCGVEPHAISPSIKVLSSSLVLEWYIPGAAAAYMIEMATVNKDLFIVHGFVYLKITTVVILDERCRDTVSI